MSDTPSSSTHSERRTHRHVERGRDQLFEAPETNAGRASVCRSPPRGPCLVYLVDLLHIDRYDIQRVPLRYRKEPLGGEFKFREHLRFTIHREKEGEA
jgi:hypothetical protein